MIVLSLFDGISCARVALQRAGFDVELYLASEVDKYAIQVAKQNRSETQHVGNVKSIRYGNGRFECEEGEFDMSSVDLLIGGSPCQDLSIAKKNRKGLDGDKSSLFREYVRILKETKPKRFILENVASMPKDAQKVITETLGVEPIMINAALVSAQSRKRLFRTNIPGVTLPEDKGILLKDIIEDEVDEKFNVKGCALRTRPRNQTGGKRQKRIEVREDGKANCMTSVDTDSLILGPVRLGHMNSGGQCDRIYSEEGKGVCLSANGGGRGAKTGLYHIQQKAHGFNKGGIHTEKSPTLTASRREMSNHLVGDDVVRKLTPVECERLQCLPDEYTSGISNSQRYKCLGNAFNVDVVAHILSFIPKK